MSATNDGARYKDSVHLPVTEFPMKANLPQREPEIIRVWNEKKLYENILKKNAGKKSFTLPDGPPYANGNIHIGHALNKILKDIVVKYKNMSGYAAPFIPGWDCHGLPIELGVGKELGAKRAQITDVEFRQKCREFASQWIEKQKTGFVRLGVLADWDHPYMTMQPVYEAEEIRQLAKMVDTQAFYGGIKPVYWCLPLQTALADTEVEYHEHKSPAVYVKFYVKTDAKNILPKNKKVSFVIWTTTPWTLPANFAICLRPDFDYAVFEFHDEYLVIAKGLQESFEKDTDLKLKLASEKTWKGKELEGIVTQHPFIERNSPIILGDHVTLEAGTGCVHTAPGHGNDDYIVGKKYGLPIYSPVDAAGKYTNEVPEYEGKEVFAANPLIVERLKASGHLLAYKEITHSYPHCWRTKTPLIFRSTPQWFLSMDSEKSQIRKSALAEIEKVKWVPKWGQNRITAMVENRPDWCLSRQRIWGVPIPVFYCKSCEHPLVDSKIMQKVADEMERDGGLEAFHKYPSEKFTEGHKCVKCSHSSFQKSKDILDVWFDSGVCHAAVQAKRTGLTQQADLYLEGSDQHRGWFQTSLLTSVATTGKAPYHTVLTHGFVNDLQGRKMSKSLGNVVDPADIIKNFGAEMLRLWTAYEDYGQDLTCGKESFERLSETYRRIRNTIRFLLGNTHDFDPQKDAVEFKKMTELDQWALMQLNQLIETCTKGYENYEFHKIYQALNNFVTVDLSAIYLDILKDRLYTSKKTGLERRSAQTVLNLILENICGLMAPILSFLAEETYQYVKNKKVDSILLTDFPKVNPAWNLPEVKSKFDVILDYRKEASVNLEELRRQKIIGSSLEAKVTLQAPLKDLNILRTSEKYLAGYLIISQVTLQEGERKAVASKADGEKCERCWKYDVKTNANSQLPGICPPCVEALT